MFGSLLRSEHAVADEASALFANHLEDFPDDLDLILYWI